jgi:SAM-dependent methyltransferase
MSEYESRVREHYAQQATDLGLSPLSTMGDEIVRERELDAISRYVEAGSRQGTGVATVIDVGCGNGYALARLREKFAHVELVGIDLSPEMIALAEKRGIPNCAFMVGDVRDLRQENNSQDVVVSERCIINLLDRSHQQAAFNEIHRVLRPGGICILIEGFVEGMDALNRARAEFDLRSIPVPVHNLFFDEEWFRSTIDGLFCEDDYRDENLPKPNFLSSHYFISRVVHAAIARNEVRNSEFVKFFSFLPPSGNYASTQLRVIHKLAE